MVLQLRNDCGEAVDDVWERVETLEAKAGGLDDDVQDVQQHTQKLDAHINDMLKKMLGTLDRGQPQAPTLSLPHPFQLL